jgi:regulator of protease activity HflC (stomatin/prohibitin superfamily)
MKAFKDFYIAGQVIIILLVLAIFSCFLSVVNAGERGILMEFGEVQETILGEGIHVILPIVNTVEKLSVRVQKQEVSTRVASKDLQEILIESAVNWHILPEKANLVFQRIGNEQAIIDRVIDPAAQEIFKAVIARYTAEEIITQRDHVKTEIDQQLTARLAAYQLAVDDIALVEIRFSAPFSEAVEAKQIAEQETKRAEFIAARAMKEAEAKINLAQGEAQALSLLQKVLTPEVLKRQVIEKWDGQLPLVMDKNGKHILDIDDLVDSRLNHHKGVN